MNYLQGMKASVNQKSKLAFSFLITNEAAPLGSCLSSLRPPSRLRLVVPWYSCRLIWDGDDGSREFQHQTTRAVSACIRMKKKICCENNKWDAGMPMMKHDLFTSTLRSLLSQVERLLVNSKMVYPPSSSPLTKDQSWLASMGGR